MSDDFVNRVKKIWRDGTAEPDLRLFVCDSGPFFDGDLLQVEDGTYTSKRAPIMAYQQVKSRCPYCRQWAPEFDNCPHCGAPYIAKGF